MSDEEYKPRQKPVLTKEQKVDLSKRNRTVSYTHLTLPTICSV